MAKEKQETSSEPTYARFAAPEGYFISGIPARDLTRAEWDELSEELRTLALGSGLYTIA